MSQLKPGSADSTGSGTPASAPASDSGSFSPTASPGDPVGQCPLATNKSQKVVVYRKMSEAEAQKTLEDGQLQGPIKGSNGKKYLSESQGKAADFENKKVSDPEKVIAFDLDKAKYDEAMKDSVAQKEIQGNPENKKKIETHYEGLHEDPDKNPENLKNIGVPPEKLADFNKAVLAVRDVTDESDAMKRGPEVKPKKEK